MGMDQRARCLYLGITPKEDGRTFSLVIIKEFVGSFGQWKIGRFVRCTLDRQRFWRYRLPAGRELLV